MAKDLTKLLATASKVPTAQPAAVGAPVRNVQRSPEVEKQKGRGVRTISLSLFPPQEQKLDRLAAFLDDNDLGYNDSLAFRTALAQAERNEALVTIAQGVAEGAGYVKKNVMAYKEDEDLVKEVSRFLRRHGVGRYASIAHRAVLEAAHTGPDFLKLAKDLKERRDRRGKTTA